MVELLVVISIIALLVGLLIPAVVRARLTARQAAIKAEISQLETAIESYRNDIGGGAYPPDAMVGIIGTGPTNTPQNVADGVVSDFKRHFKKAFPRHREPDSLLDALVGVGTGSNPNLTGGMSPAEVMVFWLQRFSSDPKYPISGPGGPAFSTNDAPRNDNNDPIDNLAGRNWLLDFAEDRYGPRDDENFFAGRFIEYQEPFDFDGDNNTDTLRINFWIYNTPRSAEPVMYFDASRGIHDIEHPGLVARNIEAFALKQLQPGASLNANGQAEFSTIRLANEGKFQILHTGNDDEWGNFNRVRVAFNLDPTDPAVDPDGDPILLFPNGPFTLELADTVANFADQPSLEDNQP